MKNQLAQFISLVLSPVTWVFLLLIVIIKNNGYSSERTMLLGLALFFLQLGVPLLYLFILLKAKKVNDLDLTKRTERYRVIIVTTFCGLIALGLTYFMGSEHMFKLQALLLLVLVVNGAITFFWKISFHMTGCIVGALLLNLLSGNQYLYLYIAIPLVYWARIQLKKHTHGQLIAALVLNLIVVLAFFRFVM